MTLVSVSVSLGELQVVSERLGHSKIEVTLNTYSHLLPTMQTSAVTALTAALDQKQ